MQSGTKMFTCDKFLGINEAADGTTELKLGEASKMVNWALTDGCNLTLRPGIRRVDFGGERDPQPILAAWSGFVGEREYFVLCDFNGKTDRLWLYAQTGAGMFRLVLRQEGTLGITYAAIGLTYEEQSLPPEEYAGALRKKAMVKLFPFAGRLYVMSRVNTLVYREGRFAEAGVYVPTVITGASPKGGGTTLESLNQLTALRCIEYSADGTSTAYALPAEAKSVEAVEVDNAAQEPGQAGSFDISSHTFTFAAAPVKGVANVKLTYGTDPALTEETRLRLAAMPLVESYNGSTDTRLFFAGDGTNLCFYSGVPLYGTLEELYFPAMNEVAVDMSDSPVTGLVRHYSKLLVFKPDGCFSISYEPVTLPGGDTIGGFYLRSINRDFGNDAAGQVTTVNNYPRTISHGGVYEWRITSSYYKDERYARRVSDAVQRTLAQADLTRAVACDDNGTRTFYLFLNDEDGTVLVNRYALAEGGLWCLYRSPRSRGIRRAAMCGGVMVFCNDTEAFWFSGDMTMDAPAAAGGQPEAIGAVWESGFLSFGADYRRKYSSQVFVSVRPLGSQQVTVTASTDRREEYMEKVISMRRFSWNTATFPNWIFDVSSDPAIHRVRLKVKKFVYYKLIFKIDQPGATATILGYDQQVRYSSMAK